MDALIACIDPAVQDMMKSVMAGFKELTAKQAPVKKLVAEKFGKELAEKLFKEEGDPAKELTKDMSYDVAKAKIEEKGDAATVTIEGKNKPLLMKKVDGKWWITPEESPEEIKKGADMVKGMVEKMGKALDEVAKKINDGTITKDKAEQQIGEIMMKALMG